MYYIYAVLYIYIYYRYILLYCIYYIAHANTTHTHTCTYHFFHLSSPRGGALRAAGAADAWTRPHSTGTAGVRFGYIGKNLEGCMVHILIQIYTYI